MILSKILAQIGEKETGRPLLRENLSFFLWAGII